MKLDFESGLVESDLYEELEFDSFLKLFNYELPLLANIILRPLSRASATEQYKQLSQLRQQIESHRVDLNEILGQARQLQPLTQALSFFKDGMLEPYHLFELGRFIETDQQLIELEGPVTEVCKHSPYDQILAVLQKHLESDYGTWKLSEEEKTLKQSIDQKSEEIADEIHELESLIFKQTGLKLTYPYPRELEPNDSKGDKLHSCPFVNVKSETDRTLVSITLTHSALGLISERDQMQRNWVDSANEKLKRINDELHPFFADFEQVYRQRKRRLTLYCILKAMEDYDLTLPKIEDFSGFFLKKGRLPRLADKLEKEYIPLDLKFNLGVNILFGANMSGKTTVLKTVYFHLILTMVGLPVPAKSLKISFPENTGFQLKSSGKIQKGLSGFGEEIDFLSTKRDEGSYCLLDELFHSTDPLNAVKLSWAFIDHFNSEKSYFFFTSHFPEVLDIPGINCLRMKDFGEETGTNELDKVLKNVPYEVESILPTTLKNSIKDYTRPLEVALEFPLPEKVRKNITKQIEDK